MHDNITELLKGWGMLNPARVQDLIKDAIDFYNLDLKGLTVLTETGSRYFVVTPIIAALAGAEVCAITGDSRYGKKEDIREYTETFAKYCNVRESITIHYEKKPEIINKANIVTNLGFVRPINKQFIKLMNECAVIPYMYETWEYRDGDVDLKTCYDKKIPVLGTNEMYPGKEVFNYSGHLCAKMLFELDIEIFKSKIVIVSKDQFGPVIWRFLSALGADAYIVDSIFSINHRQYLRDCDAIIVADYHASTPVIGDINAQITPKELLAYSEKISVVHFAGKVEIESLLMHGIPCVPQIQLGRVMGKTLADLGPKPVIDLHTAGLKVGEVMARARLEGKNMDEALSIALTSAPAQGFLS